MGVEWAIGGALRGSGDTKYPLLVTLSSLVGARLGLAIGFSLAGKGPEWVYGALLVDYMIKATLLAVRFRSCRWQPAPTPAVV